MNIDLLRTFGDFAHEPAIEGETDWSEYFGSRRGRLTWSDLHSHRVVVVLGEAGIGKTIEFQMETKRLTNRGHAAFFLPLNLLAGPDGWALALTDVSESYNAWLRGEDVGHFFLDAVDEARLRAPEDFTRALLVVRQALSPHLARVRVAISSRVTDWSVGSVKDDVHRLLVDPIHRAVALSTSSPPQQEEVTDARATEPCGSERLLVVTLDALSRAEAQRYACAIDLEQSTEFWAMVDDGDYDFMASRPLDLRWMVVLWNQQRTMGNYLELIEANIRNRLLEFNESYRATAQALSPDQLQRGAMELAAAAVFGGYAFIGLDPSPHADPSVLAGFEVLDGWQPIEVQRLLASAIFDEASYGRVRFHHRSIREYLAARWLRDKLQLGVPLKRIEPLLAGRPFDELTAVPALRPVISWLAAIDVKARSWVVRHFPELLLYEGDPQSWDATSADLALLRLVERSRDGPRIRWYATAAEYRRVSRVLSPHTVVGLMGGAAPHHARRLAFQLARHGRLRDCAEPALMIFRDKGRTVWERCSALAVLEVTATTEQRAVILSDLEGESLGSNELIAYALLAVSWKDLEPSRLAAIFAKTDREGAYGVGAMARAVKEDLLPEADLAAASRLLEAVLATLPRPVAGEPFARFPEENQPEHAWLLDVLPDCLERVLNLCASAAAQAPDVCLEAVERMEAMRDSGFTDREEFTRLHAAVKVLSDLRWRTALTIARSQDINHSVNRLTWGTSCLVSFDDDDLGELTRRATDVQLTADEREIWFHVGVNVALRHLRAHRRAEAMRALCRADFEKRFGFILGEYRSLQRGARQQREWKLDNEERQGKQDEDFSAFKERLLTRLPGIADATDAGALTLVLRVSFDIDRTAVDLDAIASRLGCHLAGAFGRGLDLYWRKLSVPKPADYPGGQVPWSALTALAGANLALTDATDLATLTDGEVMNAAQLAVWALPGPPSWLPALHRVRGAEVAKALQGWVHTEAQTPRPGNGVRGALALALACPTEIRKHLLAGLVPLALAGSIPSDETAQNVVAAMIDDGLLTGQDLASISTRALERNTEPEGCIRDLSWLRIWASGEARPAWSWFQGLVAMLGDKADTQVAAFARTMGNLKWLAQPWRPEDIQLLLEIANLLRQHLPASTSSADDDSAFLGPPCVRMLDFIAKTLVDVRGERGHAALNALRTAEKDDERRWSLSGLILEHAEREVTTQSRWSQEQLSVALSPFASEPRTEAQLYEQVIARLEEIRITVEEGPFSERDLFRGCMPEKHLQRWLAAKLRDTQNRRFSIHREEEVDDDKRTDIQLSCPAGNVCVEVKPLDESRSYSATSLVEDTLKRQLVGQYLKGTNSTRGVLVLMQLDTKRWVIPGVDGLCSFDRLISHLQHEACGVKASATAVSELTVLGIRCVV